MRTKKILLIPSAVLCLATLAACGKGASRFTNGFESPELETRFKIPSNLQRVSKEYGKFVYEQAQLNTSSAKSSDTTLQVAGYSPFFKSNDSYGLQKKSNGSTPYSDSYSMIYGKNITKKYDDSVTLHTEQSYRSATNARGQNTISNETDLAYIGYLEKDEKVADKYNLYTVTKGTPSILSNNPLPLPEGKRQEEIAYRTKANSEPDDFNTLKDKLGLDAYKLLINDFKSSIPLAMGSIKKILSTDPLFQNCNLQAFDLEGLLKSSNFSQDNAPADIFEMVDFLSDNKNTIYANFSRKLYEGYVASPLQDLTDKKIEDIPMNERIRAYQTATMTAKFTLHEDKQWYCEYAGTNTKAYVTKDADLKEYAKPYCICSAYAFSELGYNSCGNYGNVEKIEQEYNPTTYGVEVDVIDENDKQYKSAYKYNSFDTNLEHIGGIYDFTMSFRKLGLISEPNERAYYGIFDLSESEEFLHEDEETSHTSTNLSIALSLVDEEKDTVDLFKDSSKVKFDGEYFEVGEGEPNRLIAKVTACTYEFTIIFKVNEETGVLSELKEVKVNYYSNESSPSSY